MLEKEKEGEPEAFAQCRKSLWKLCEVSEQAKRRNLMGKKTKTNIFVEPALWQEFKRLANEKGMKVYAFVEQAIKAQIEKEKQA